MSMKVNTGTSTDKKGNSSSSWRKLYPFKSNYISINGLAYHYLDLSEGPPAPSERRPLVMLHGNPTWSFYYRNLAREFSRDYRVIVPDHIGMGLSDKPQDYPYTLKNHIANLTRLIDTLSLKNITLVIHDWGGPIGLGYAVRHPENIRAMVILNTSAFLSSRLPFRIAICRPDFPGKLLVRVFNGFARLALHMAVEKKLSRSVAEGFLAPYYNYATRIGIHRFVQDIPVTPDIPSYPVMKEIEEGLVSLENKPILLLWGARDWCFTTDFYDMFVKRFPGAEKHLIENAGHYVLEDAFDEVLHYMRRFLARLVP